MVRIKYGPLVFSIKKNKFKFIKKKQDYFEYVKFFYSLPIYECNYIWDNIQYKYLGIFKRSSGVNIKVFMGLDTIKQKPIIVVI